MFPIHTILHPTDFSEQADHAFQMACALARDHRARLIVLHVMPYPPIVYPEGIVLSQEDLRPKLLENLQKIEPPDPSIPIERLLLDGDASTQILETARDRQCDLIVLGTHGWTGLCRLLMGSVAESVMRRGSCPVLTVKTPFKDGPAGQTAPVSDKALEAVRA